jgi:hypothetical protein
MGTPPSVVAGVRTIGPKRARTCRTIQQGWALPFPRTGGAPSRRTEDAFELAFAQFGLVVEGGIEQGGEQGGDQNVELLFTSGGTQWLSVCQGGTLVAGVHFQPARIPRLSAMATVGYKFVTNASNNSSIGLTRILLEAIGHWQLVRDFSISAGVVRHAAVKLTGDGLLRAADLNSSTGVTVELAWRWAVVSDTAMNYTAQNGAKLNAGDVGAFV